MSIKLRDLIRNVRACKTAAEERAVIAKECALIRTSFKEEDATFRHRNVAKLLFVHMLGYPSHFGQMECLKLIASPRFLDKRVGYLGLALLVQDSTEVLTLVTNSLSSDLVTTKSPYVQGLALAALGNIANPDMLRDLSGQVLKQLSNTNVYVRKKALLVSVQVFKKVPDMVEDFVPVIISLLSDRNHAVMLGATAALIEVAENHPSFVKKLRKAVPQLVKNLKTLVLSGYAPEYDVNGITDPFLQVLTLRLLALLGKDSASATEAMNDILALVATNTEGNKNSGNAILYECVRAIVSIDCEDGLRVLAVNILGRFLQNRDNNIRYVALTMLHTVVSVDREAVQRHQSIIVDCLRDSDLSIRVRAVDLVFALMQTHNVEMLCKEVLNYLVVAPENMKGDLCARLGEAALKLSPSKQWHVHLLISIMSIAGRHAPTETWERCVALIGQPESEMYRAQFTHRLFAALKEDASQTALVAVAVWTIGEFGHLLQQAGVERFEADGTYEPVNGDDILYLLESVRKRHDATLDGKAMILVTLAKLAVRLHGYQNRIVEMLRLYERSVNLELQSRACELHQLVAGGPIDDQWLAQMPVPTDEEMAQRRVTARADVSGSDDEKGSGSDEDSGPDSDSASDSPKAKAKKGKAPKASVSNGPTQPALQSSNLLDLDDIFGGGSVSSKPTVSSTQAPNAPDGQIDLLAGIFGGSATSQPVPVVPQSTMPSNDLFDVFGGAPASMQQSTAETFAPIQAYNSNGVVVVFNCARGTAPQETVITANYTNSSAQPVSNFLFQVAVPQYITHRLDKPSGNQLGPFGQGSVQQLIHLVNSKQGEKPLMLKIKVTYTLATGQQVVDQATVKDFPASL